MGLYLYVMSSEYGGLIFSTATHTQTTWSMKHMIQNPGSKQPVTRRATEEHHECTPSKSNRYEGCMPWLETPSLNTTIPIQVSYEDELELQHYFRLYSMLTTCTTSVSAHIRGRNKYTQRFLSTHAKKFNPTEIRTSKGL